MNQPQTLSFEKAEADHQSIKQFWKSINSNVEMPDGFDYLGDCEAELDTLAWNLERYDRFPTTINTWTQWKEDRFRLIAEELGYNGDYEQRIRDIQSRHPQGE